MENKPFEDVFPIENGDIPASYVSLPEGNIQVCSYMRGQHHAIQQAISTNLRGMEELLHQLIGSLSYF